MLLLTMRRASAECEILMSWFLFANVVKLCALVCTAGSVETGGVVTGMT